MNASNHISYLPHARIDKAKWDDCIGHAGNGNIYAFSYYLDRMCSHWDALVVNDYETVMPLTWNRKFGIYYLYQPAFTASLGVFGNRLAKNTTGDFIKAIPKKFRLAEVAFNHANDVNATPELSLHVNYVLPLHEDASQLVKRYHDNTRRNIAKAVNAGLSIKKNIPAGSVIDLSKPVMEERTNIKPPDYTHFEDLAGFLKSRDQAITYGVYSTSERLLAGAVFFYSHARAYYILAGNSTEAKNTGAPHLLIDTFIRDHAGKQLLLDFEGSDIPSLARFYSGFGATLETYPFFTSNKLPWWARWAK